MNNEDIKDKGADFRKVMKYALVVMPVLASVTMIGHSISQYGLSPVCQIIIAVNMLFLIRYILKIH